MGDRFVRIDAAPVLVSTVERRAQLGENEVTGDLAFLLGDPGGTALVVEGSREQLREWVRVMAAHVGLRVVDGDVVELHDEPAQPDVWTRNAGESGDVTEWTEKLDGHGNRVGWTRGRSGWLSWSDLVVDHGPVYLTRAAAWQS